LVGKFLHESRKEVAFISFIQFQKIPGASINIIRNLLKEFSHEPISNLQMLPIILHELDPIWIES
jgi:hypothetical protein